MLSVPPGSYAIMTLREWLWASLWMHANLKLFLGDMRYVAGLQSWLNLTLGSSTPEHLEVADIHTRKYCSKSPLSVPENKYTQRNDHHSTP